MDTETLNSSSDKIVSRKNFLLAAASAAAYLGSAGRAKANDTDYAYLDQSTPFTANQYFGNITGGYSTATGPVYIKSGYPWIDIMSPSFGVTQGTGLSNTVRTNNTTGINNAIVAAISLSGTPSPGTGVTGNGTVYFPPGNYEINGPIQPPNMASNYILRGAGPGSSMIYWQGAAGGSMLKLINARGVTIRDLGFLGNNGALPSYGIEINRSSGWTTGTPYPTEVVVENCFLGSTGGRAIDCAIAYTADSSSDDTIPSGFGTFRNVTIYNVNTGYKFGTTNSYGNLIICGGITDSGTAFDNTAAPYKVSGTSPYGGSYSLFGTTVIMDELIFNVGQSNGYPLNAFSVRGEANIQFMTTPADVGTQIVEFFGGFQKLADPGSGNTALYQSTGGQLEFHNFNLYASGTGPRWDFPGSAAVAFYGGSFSTDEYRFNGPLQFHEVYETGVENPPIYTNLSQGLLQEYGHNGLLAGVAPGINGNAALGITSSCFTTALNTAIVGTPSAICVEGSPMGGRITLYTGSTPVGTGQVAQISFPARYTGPAVLLFPAEGNSARAITTFYTVPNGTNSFYIYTSAPLLPTNGYIWNFIIV